MSSSLFTSVVVLWALSSVPGVTALPLCYSSSSGYYNCGYATWGVSLAVLLVIFLLCGLFCFTNNHYSEREQADIARMNMAYVNQQRDYLATTYAPYNPGQTAAASTSTSTRNGRPRPSSLSAPLTTYDKETEPAYPATAYPFAGYSVVPPPSHTTNVHNPVKAKEET